MRRAGLGPVLKPATQRSPAPSDPRTSRPLHPSSKAAWPSGFPTDSCGAWDLRRGETVLGEWLHPTLEPKAFSIQSERPLVAYSSITDGPVPQPNHAPEALLGSEASQGSSRQDSWDSHVPIPSPPSTAGLAATEDHIHGTHAPQLFHLLRATFLVSASSNKPHVEHVVRAPGSACSFSLSVCRDFWGRADSSSGGSLLIPPDPSQAGSREFLLQQCPILGPGAD